jgi:hypothetical protein
MIDVLTFPAPDWSEKPTREDAEEALALNERGREALDEGDLDRAEGLFMESITKVPLIGIPWFNLGLVYKRRSRWTEAAACNQRSLDLGSDDQDPAFWNLGIAATALRDWSRARSAWVAYGVDIPPGGGPIEMDFGPTAIRINPHGNAEVCWGRRIDPARVVLKNVPLPGSGHRWRDIVLHDGVPSGERNLAGRTYPVFDELERWEPSSLPTWECVLTGPIDALDELQSLAYGNDIAIENWSTSIRMLCQECSTGNPGDHLHGSFAADLNGHHVGLAGALQTVTAVLDSWIAEHDGRGRTDILPVDA